MTHFFIKTRIGLEKIRQNETIAMIHLKHYLENRDLMKGRISGSQCILSSLR